MFSIGAAMVIGPNYIAQVKNKVTFVLIPLVWYMNYVRSIIICFVAFIIAIYKSIFFFLKQLNLLKAKQKALVEQMEKEKIQSNKGSSYKLLVEQAKLKQATSKVWFFNFQCNYLRKVIFPFIISNYLNR